MYVLGLDRSDRSRTKFVLITVYPIEPTFKERKKAKKKKEIEKEMQKIDMYNLEKKGKKLILT